ncbi:porin [Colwellia sp. 1_MG-2023]|uniref:porin n=1 Tax=Colwellia sp. 1_MG-2023 TaxID=3062649 RepID=UPI0026E45B4D|nr:porin [Colwellia sp. 1_MG-2023]MDO6445937.1 porin [Colwellia sp. 1_MG-2023]
MKKSLISMALLLASTAVFAGNQSDNTSYPKNPILRPLTLSDGTIAVSGAVSWGEEKNKSRGELNLNVAYGLTDNLTIGFGGLNYRILARDNNQTGLELAVGAGIRGFQDSTSNGDAIGYGADLNGKYVFNQDIAMTFSLGYVIWDEEHLANKSENRFSIGVQSKVTKNWTAFNNYTYRDLKGFSQEDSHSVTSGLNYTFSKDIDVGLYASYSDFEAQENGYKLKNNFERSAGLYATYRF